jgi:hypothetical protein
MAAVAGKGELGYELETNRIEGRKGGTGIGQTRHFTPFKTVIGAEEKAG